MKLTNKEVTNICWETYTTDFEVSLYTAFIVNFDFIEN